MQVTRMSKLRVLNMTGPSILFSAPVSYHFNSAEIKHTKPTESKHTPRSPSSGGGGMHLDGQARGVMCHLPTLASANQLAATTGACHICGVLLDRIGRGEMNSAL